METLKIIKIGGNIIDDDIELDAFLSDFSKLEGPKILVHGGGKSATKLANQINVDVKMTKGRRITDANTLDVITMVYAGKINKTIVAKLQAFNCNALGLSGADGNSITSVKRLVKDVDFGFVGDIEQVNINLINILLSNDITPVFCAITHDKKGQLLNTNADTIASALAIGFSSDYNTVLYYCFEKCGVLKDVNDDTSVIECITTKTYERLIQNNSIADGMLPKLDNCFYALNNNVKEVSVGGANMPFNSNLKFTKIQK